jgi:quercetin dioxygenase-like cupin family protein
VPIGTSGPWSSDGAANRLRLEQEPNLVDRRGKLRVGCADGGSAKWFGWYTTHFVGGVMDIRSAASVEVEVAHRESIHVWWLVRPRELKSQTAGGFLELVSEFDVKPGGQVAPHSHPTHEWYYVLSGLGVMHIEAAEESVEPGDLVYIPPRTEHSLVTTGDEPIRCLCFAIAEPDAPEIDYMIH